MIRYQAPPSAYAEAYKEQSLMYAAVASHKNHMAVYRSAIYADHAARERFEKAYRETGAVRRGQVLRAPIRPLPRGVTR